MNPEKYTYQISWSEEDSEYVATVLEFPSLSWLDPERTQAEQGLLNLVAAILADRAESGEKIPTPLGERFYSGKFNVRTSHSPHRRLVMEAESEGVSLNTWINQKLASA